jgi:hypothetical protein
MRYKYTLIFAIVGAAICLMHYIGHDSEPVYLLFYGLSIPAWYYPLFNYTDVNAPVLYSLTTLSWALIGYVIDSFPIQKKAKQ